MYFLGEISTESPDFSIAVPVTGPIHAILVL